MEAQELRPWRTIGACVWSCAVSGTVAHLIMRKSVGMTALAWMIAVLPATVARARAARAAPPTKPKERKMAMVMDAANIFAGVGSAGALGAPAMVAAVGAERLFTGASRFETSARTAGASRRND